MSFLFSGMRKDGQTAIANLFGVPSFQIMETWLRALNVTRNICAHHSRLWNKPNAVPPKWPTPADCPDLGPIATDTHARTRLYGISCICAHLLRTVNPNSTWIRAPRILIKNPAKRKSPSALSRGHPPRVGISTIQRIEQEDRFPAARGGNIDAVYKALSAAGITFLPENDDGVGVRGKSKAKRSGK
jgi:hypothetical protein